MATTAKRANSLRRKTMTRIGESVEIQRYFVGVKMPHNILRWAANTNWNRKNTRELSRVNRLKGIIIGDPRVPHTEKAPLTLPNTTVLLLYCRAVWYIWYIVYRVLFLAHGVIPSAHFSPFRFTCRLCWLIQLPALMMEIAFLCRTATAAAVWFVF